jgi:hypothetical protein
VLKHTECIQTSTLCMCCFCSGAVTLYIYVWCTKIYTYTYTYIHICIYIYTFVWVGGYANSIRCFCAAARNMFSIGTYVNYAQQQHTLGMSVSWYLVRALSINKRALRHGCCARCLLHRHTLPLSFSVSLSLPFPLTSHCLSLSRARSLFLSLALSLSLTHTRTLILFVAGAQVLSGTGGGRVAFEFMARFVGTF